MKKLLDDPIAPELRAMLRSAEDDAPPAPVKRQDRIIAAIAAASTVGTAGSAAVAVAGPTRLVRIAKWTAPLLGVAVVATFAIVSGSREHPAADVGVEPSAPSAAQAETPVKPEPPPSVPSQGVRVEDLPSAAASASRPAPRAESETARTAITSEAIARPPPAPEPNIDAEIAAIDKARAALTSGRGAEALARVQTYRSTFADPHFADEADAIEVQALAALGRTDEARRKGEEFIARNARSPYAQRVRSAAGLK